MKGKRASLGGLALAAFCAGCDGGSSSGPEPAPVAEAVVDKAPEVVSGLHFVDGTESSGLGVFHQVNGSEEKHYITETMGGGVALFDADQDGDLDAYFANGSSHEGFAPGEAPRDTLFAGRGDGTFEDVTEGSGLGDTEWTMGVRVVDFDGDGLLEPFLTNYGPNALYRNVGGGRFEDVTAASGLADERWSTGAAFFDYDRDGDLDVYVVNYVDFDLEWVDANKKTEDYHGVSVAFGPRGLPGEHDAFYVNAGDGHFQDASEAVGIAEPAKYGFNAVVFDYDLDGWLDLYIGNDSEANLLWHNEEGKRFAEIGLRASVAMSKDGAKQAGMGVALGDFNGDLAPDIFVTNFAEDYFTLYRGSSKGWFTDVSVSSRIASVTNPMLGWGCGFADFDFDGDQDIFAVNGHVYPQVDQFDFGIVYRQKNVLLENIGGGRMQRVGGGPGFDLQAASRGTAVGDVDGDGDLDLLINNIDSAPSLLINETVPAGAFLAVRLRGPAGNTLAIGARLIATIDGTQQLRLAGTSSGFLSSNEQVLRFGLGASDRVDKLEVHWPTGETSSFEDLPAGHLVTIDATQGIVSTASY